MRNILQLATDLDRFAFDYDPYGYWDAVDDREQAVTSLLAQLCSSELRVGIVDCLQEIADEHDEYEVPAIKLISQIAAL